MDWFEQLMGFKESSPEQVRENIIINGKKITSKVNDKTYHFGHLQLDSLAHLRRVVAELKHPRPQKNHLREVVGDVQLFHLSLGNEHALFQAASQFNLLEMVSPSVSPESGVGKYEYDKTQGPACAIACGAGTIYRNYFVSVNGKIGQTTNNQIDCLQDIGTYFDNENRLLWRNRNGYALANAPGLDYINSILKSLNEVDYEALKGKLQVGVQWDTQVTIAPQPLRVSQIYCSALPVGYSDVPAAQWEPFARLVLEATYEATLLAGIINRANYGSNKVFLTLVGGGVFGNDSTWLVESISKVLRQYRAYGLDIAFVSYGQPSAVVSQIITKVTTDVD